VVIVYTSTVVVASAPDRWGAVGESVVQEISRAFEVKIAVEFAAYATISREF
jgi:hypothetical protein